GSIPLAPTILPPVTRLLREAQSCRSGAPLGRVRTEGGRAMISKLGAPASRCFALLARLEGFPILIVRVVLGVMFAQSGYGKLFKNHDGVVSFFTSLGI